MIYLCSPYTHPDPHEMEYRYERILEITAHFLSRGHHVYSPIVHCHPLAVLQNLPKDFSFWSSYNCHMLNMAEEVWVIQLDGWHTSRGVNAEIAEALTLGKPVIYFEFEGLLGGEDNQHGGSELR